MPARLRVGLVRSANPARREVRVQPLAGYVHEFESREWLWFRPPGAPEVKCRVAGVRWSQDLAVVALVAGVPRDTVAALKGAAVLLAPEECRPRPDVPRKAEEWLGWRVETMEGEPMGSVVEVYATRANEAFVVRREDGKGMVLPAIPEVVADVDAVHARLRVRDAESYGVEL